MKSVAEFRSYLDARGQGGGWSDEQLAAALRVAQSRAKYSEDSDAAPGRMMIREEKFLEVWRDRDVDGNEYLRYGIAVGPPSQESPQ